MNQLKTLLLLGLLTALLVWIGGALGPGYLYGFTAFALVMNLVAYFFSDRIVLAMHRAREVSVEEAPRLHAIVEDLARAADQPKPRVFIIPQAQPNAFATLDLGARRIPAHVEPATASLFIVNPFSGGRGLINLFSTHPDMEERIRRLRAFA